MEKPILIEPEMKPPLHHQTLTPSSSGRRSSRTSINNNDHTINSPEFEFWMVRNPSFPAPNLLSADELFVDGVLLPLCLVPNPSDLEEPPPPPDHESNPQPQPPTNLETLNPHEPEEQNPLPVSEESSVGGAEIGPEPGPGPESSANAISTSKRWRDIFKVGTEKKSTGRTSSSSKEDNNKVEKEKNKIKKKDRKSCSTNSNSSNSSSSNGGGSNTAELNINIWPFSRSRSAGNSGNRPKMGASAAAAATRKVSSAPCSRSNSRGESSKSRKWPSSPSRGGVAVGGAGGGGIHLGRSSPVWQVRRGGSGSGLKNTEAPAVRNAEPNKGSAKKDGSSKSRLGNNAGSSSGAGGGSGGGGVGGLNLNLNLNLNVPMCMGYRQNSSCRSDESSRLVSGGGGEESCSGGGGGVNGGNGGKLFNLRTLFSSKKVY